MTIYDEISIIANKLANKGKKPSVALVKTKLKSPVPLPTLIKALKSWQHEPDVIDNKAESEKVQSELPSSSSELENAIEQAIAPLREELTEIKILLKEVLESGSKN